VRNLHCVLPRSKWHSVHFQVVQAILSRNSSVSACVDRYLSKTAQVNMSLSEMGYLDNILVSPCRVLVIDKLSRALPIAIRMLIVKSYVFPTFLPLK
jgi:hypothetical protein